MDLNHYLKSLHLPARTAKNRTNGLTMIIDKGASISELEGALEIAHDKIDFVKFGFGTALLTNNFLKKVEVLNKYNVDFFFGGTLFEIFYAQNKIVEFIKMMNEVSAKYVEISDGTITLDHKTKCSLIEKFTKDFVVLSEVGSKDTAKVLPPYKWIEMMRDELNAGSTFLIAESREAGNVGIYRNNGEVREGLIEEILTKIPAEKIIWEAPEKSQQVFFIQLLGANVNLGNIQLSNIISLETLRLGLRSDTVNL